ncbi:hypothetical protein [Acaryochloris sp. CCMEE 5410]|uniref:hypothetical protein n=1 Tax=Acaryochloris sp. CCMEE 5410 TaxID=310037 RepID=UPI00024849B9|nr:hypothetical protein [Acaryochloris sp. CCMEE 5410]KAI9133304.1 hypothetical protein ON05_008230 [Acaryochloris sp. CCMEE 5410]
MSVSLTEAFAQDPDWSIISVADRPRVQELVTLICTQVDLPRNQKGEEYYGWLIELNRMIN